MASDLQGNDTNHTSNRNVSDGLRPFQENNYDRNGVGGAAGIAARFGIGS